MEQTLQDMGEDPMKIQVRVVRAKELVKDLEQSCERRRMWAEDQLTRMQRSYDHRSASRVLITESASSC